MRRKHPLEQTKQPFFKKPLTLITESASCWKTVAFIGGMGRRWCAVLPARGDPGGGREMCVPHGNLGYDVTSPLCHRQKDCIK